MKMDVLKEEGAYVITRSQLITAALIAVAVNNIFLVSKIFQDTWSLFLAYSINLLSLTAIVIDQIKTRKNKVTDYFKIFFISYIFPFSGTCYILYNQDSFLMYSYFLIGFFLFLEFINHRFKELFIVISVFAGLIIMALAFTNLLISIQAKNFYLVIFFFLFAISYHHYKFKKSAYSQMERLKILGGSIAHELRTPLATITIGTQSLKKLLLQVFQPFEEHPEIISLPVTFTRDQVDLLTQVPLSLHKTAREASLLIDMLLTKIKSENLGIVYTQQCDAKTIVEEVLNIYPFSSREKKLIKFDSEKKFVFQSSPEAVRHIFFNLIRNALYQIQRYNKGEIHICFQNSKKYNTIHFKDTAIGISDEKIPTLFSEVQVSTSNGTGLGLPFCKIIMENSQGNIICHSVFGEYVEFVLQFPIVQ